MTRPSTPSVICRVAALALAFVLTWLSSTRTDRQAKTSAASSAAWNNHVRPPATGVSKAQSVEIAQSYGKLPLTFEANYGRSANHVKFRSWGSGYTLFLAPDEVVLALKKPRKQSSGSQKRASRKSRNEMTSSPSHEAVNGGYLRMKLLGANSKAAGSGTDELPGRSNYFIGNDPSKWRTNVPTYAKVKYEDVYPGVDLVYYGNQRQLEYDFIVSPGVDPKVIQLSLRGTERWRVDEQGALVLGAKTKTARFEPPVAYQLIGGEKQVLNARYTVSADNTVGFDIDTYDRSKPLVIDPVLAYSTYLAGGDDPGAFGIAVDSNGDAYVVGLVWNVTSAFPTVSPLQATFGGGTSDAYIAKLNSNGTALVYATYLGGSGDELPFGIAVDSQFNAYVTGITHSTDFPLKNPFQTVNHGGFDAFVAKLDPSGSTLVYSTYLGGTSDEGATGVGVCGGIAIDSSGNAYVAGGTNSGDFPVTTNAFRNSITPSIDGFLTKLSVDGSSLVYSTYLAGAHACGVRVDAAGNAYLTGATANLAFPILNGFQTTHGAGPAIADGFVMVLNPSGTALVYSTFLGGSQNDGGYAIAIDGSKAAYVTGYTRSTDFPTKNAAQSVYGGGQSDAFVAKLDPFQVGPASLIYSTFLGGSQEDNGFTGKVAVDSMGDAWVTGYTLSTEFPTVNPFQSVCKGCNSTISADAFVTEVSANGSSFLYSTFLGGKGDTNYGSFCCGLGITPSAIAVDRWDSVYVAGETNAPDFPTTAGVFQTGNPNGGTPYASFISKFSALGLSSSSLNFANQLVGTSSSPQAVSLSNTGASAISIANIVFVGTNAADYSQTNTCGTNVAAGGNCTINVTFAPGATGARAGSLSFSLNGAPSPQTVSLSGVGTDFTLAPASGSPTSATFTAGQSATLNLQVNPVSGFTGAVSLACTGAPAQSTCNTSAPSVSVTGASPTPFSVTITTTAPGLLPPGTLRRPWPHVRQSPPIPYTILVLLCVLVVVLNPSRRNRSRPAYAWATARLLLACLGITLVSMSGCGGGGSSTPPPPTGTPAGTYNLTVTGSSQGQNRTITLVLTVN